MDECLGVANKDVYDDHGQCDCVGEEAKCDNVDHEDDCVKKRVEQEDRYFYTAINGKDDNNELLSHKLNTDDITQNSWQRTVPDLDFI